MRIHYKLKFFDYFCYNAIHQFSLITVQVLNIGLGLMFYYSEREENGTLVAIIAGVLAYFIGWSFQLVVNLFVLYSAKNRTLLTDHEVEIQQDCFYEENPFSRSFHKWAGIVKVADRPGFVVVYINVHAAHIIPNRAFESKSQRGDFLRQIRAKIAAV